VKNDSPLKPQSSVKKRRTTRDALSRVSVASRSKAKSVTKNKSKSGRTAKLVVAKKASRSQKDVPGSYHHGNLRAALIEAGLEELKTKEWQQLSLRALTRRAGVSPNAAYRHFATKEALLVALAAEGMRRLHAAQIKTGERHGEPVASFRAIGRAYIQFAIDNPALFRLIFARFIVKRQDPETVELSIANFRKMFEITAAMGKIDPEDPKVILNFLLAWSTVHGLSYMALDGQLDHFGGATNELLDSLVYSDLPFWYGQ
jgi:AcrR family transcriptional regulator